MRSRIQVFYVTCFAVLILPNIAFTQQKPVKQKRDNLVDRSNQLKWGSPAQRSAHQNTRRFPTDRVKNKPVIDENLVPASFLYEENASSKTGDRKSETENRSTIATQLPNSAGQVWREYDIRPYTSQITTSAQPQQAVLDWILRETGKEMWFNAPLGILSADKNKVRVYHTPEIQQVVQRTIDRLVNSRGQVQVLGLKLLTVSNPNWRAKAVPLMQPVRVQSPGVQGWITSKENAANLFNQLRARSDFRTVKSGDITIHDGQKITISDLRPISYYQNLEAQVDQYGRTALRPVASRIQEGFSLQLGALSSIGNRAMETVIDCRVDQIEKMQPVRVDIPGRNGQTVELQIPQMVSWRLNERFRWQTDRVLVLSCGVVATPNNDRANPFDLTRILNRSRGRADAILIIEYKGLAQRGAVPNRNPQNRVSPGNRVGDLRPVAPKR